MKMTRLTPLEVSHILDTLNVLRYGEASEEVSNDMYTEATEILINARAYAREEVIPNGDSV